MSSPTEAPGASPGRSFRLPKPPASPDPEARTRSRLTSAEQHAQATALMMRRLFDPARPTVQDLADEFGLSKETTTRRLALARTDGVPAEAREIFIREMLPAAMAVIQEVMTGDDKKLALSAAKLVVEGLDAMKIPEADKPTAGVEESFEVWRVSRRVGGAGAPPGTCGATDGAAGTIIDAQPLLPAGPPSGDAAPSPTAPLQVYVPSFGLDRPSSESAEDTPGTGAGGGVPGLADGR